MSKFITFGSGANKTVINKQDVVSIKKEPNGFIEINYRNVDHSGKAPYAIEAVSFKISEQDYQKLLRELDVD